MGIISTVFLIPVYLSYSSITMIKMKHIFQEGIITKTLDK